LAARWWTEATLLHEGEDLDLLINVLCGEQPLHQCLLICLWLLDLKVRRRVVKHVRGSRPGALERPKGANIFVHESLQCIKCPVLIPGLVHRDIGADVDGQHMNQRHSLC